jgi:hypothetical protein
MGMVLHRRDTVSQEKGPTITRSHIGCAFVWAEKTPTSYLSRSPVVNICFSSSRGCLSNVLY